jgi:PPM family protein phosphatase
MIPTPHAAHDLHYGTHPGETGKNNEDRCAVANFYGDGGDAVTLALVCDGIGGNRAGEVASDLAVKVITEAVGRSSGSDYAAILDQAVSLAARSVFEAANSRLEFKGMGTTCAAALLVGRRLYTAYAGDSRIYLARRGGIVQTTVDHTFVQEAIELGLLKPEEAKNHPHRHVVRRHLGGDPNAKADFRLRLSEAEAPEQSMRNQGVLLDPGSKLLLCSDGLSDLVEAPEILKVLDSHKPRGAVETLIKMARQRGGHDNITVIALYVAGP